MSERGFQFVPPEERLDFGRLRSVAGSALEHLNFGLFSDFGNRHGSWEITFWKKDLDLSRFVSLDLTVTIPPGHALQVFDIEIWISAEQDAHFVRRIKRHLTASQNDLNNGNFDPPLREALIEAATECSQLTPADLINTYSRSLLRRMQSKEAGTSS